MENIQCQESKVCREKCKTASVGRVRSSDPMGEADDEEREAEGEEPGKFRVVDCELVENEVNP